jgi:Kdo2-lipid IVA lauroyltransferase/acyltransferase
MNSEKTLKLIDKIILFPIWLLSLFPLEVLFIKSWGIYFLLYHVIGYRRKVVYENLRRAFPEKKEKEIRKIARRFYLHLCDSMFEVVHMIRMTPKEIDKRYKFTNPEIIEELAARNKSIVMTNSHYGNWEWAVYNNHIFDYKLLGVYKPMTNRLFERLSIYVRSRLGGIPTPINSSLRSIMDAQRNDEKFITYMVGDQRPQYGDLKNWTTFMNQDTPVSTGPEKLARRFNLATLYMDTRQIKRGYYETTLHVISENSAETEDLYITKKYFELIENQILREPEFYLWSHDRWKYNKEEILGAKK